MQLVLLLLDTEIKGDILFLGYYESEFDWSNETAKVRLLHFISEFLIISYYFPNSGPTFGSIIQYVEMRHTIRMGALNNLRSRGNN